MTDKININELNRKIIEFTYKKGYAPYVFANKETINTFTKQTNNLKINSVGRKMFRDNTLKFGEIELR